MREVQEEGKENSIKSIPFQELPLGAIKPAGWLRDQLRIQADGLTGDLGDIWEDVGPNNGWLGGSGDAWERGPYYLDGLLPLAHLLGDKSLVEKVKPWIEWALTSQREDGQFGPSSDNDWWPRMIMLKVLIQHAEATGDERVVPFMTDYFRYQSENLKERPLTGWAQARGGENLLCIQWLYQRTGDSFLLELADLIHSQTLDWTGVFSNFPYWRYQTAFDHRVHVVNVAMGLKEPMLYSLHSGKQAHREAALKGIHSLMAYHGQAHGMFSGDEWLAGTHPSQGVELCAVVEYMFTLENLVRLSGRGFYGDVLEKVAFNALPATISPDWNGHQYDQQVNQIMCTLAKRNWTQNGDDSNLFGLEPHFGCCTANMHQGWPKFSARLWMATEDGGLAAVSFTPCTVNTSVGNGVRAHLKVDSEYPFNELITIHINLSEKTTFPLKLRIPEWCESPEVLVNGKHSPLTYCDGFADLRREWEDGDVVQLTLPMKVNVEQRANFAVSVSRGPLVYALPINERWQKLRGNAPYADWELYPETPWNYGLRLDLKKPDHSFFVKTEPLERQPFSAKKAPVFLKGKGHRIPEWRAEMNSAGDLPHGPIESSQPEEDILLVPYGCARLRIAEFPLIKD